MPENTTLQDRILRKIERTRAAQAEAQAQKEAEAQAAKDAAIACLKQELAHILDGQWSVICDDPSNPVALCLLKVPKDDGFFAGFEVALIRDADAAIGETAKYLPRFSERASDGSYAQLFDGNWTPASELSIDSLEGLVAGWVCQAMSIVEAGLQ